MLVLGCAAALLTGVLLTTIFGTGLAGAQPAIPPVPEVGVERPLTIIVRGWLWDPSSRRKSNPLVEFPTRVNAALDQRHGLQTDYLQFDWTRIPKDVFGATDGFVRWARMVAGRAAMSRVCVNFVGHSGGAMMIYWAAAEGVQMGHMSTLGLPTLGAEKPPTVDSWANFYTDTHLDDIAGWMWGRNIGSDENVNLKMPHRDFWGAPAVHRASADGIAHAWRECKPGDHT